MKYLFTNQKFYRSEITLLRDFSFLKNHDIYANRATSRMFYVFY